MDWKPARQKKGERVSIITRGVVTGKGDTHFTEAPRALLSRLDSANVQTAKQLHKQLTSGLTLMVLGPDGKVAKKRHASDCDSDCDSDYDSD